MLSLPRSCAVPTEVDSKSNRWTQAEVSTKAAKGISVLKSPLVTCEPLSPSALDGCAAPFLSARALCTPREAPTLCPENPRCAQGGGTSHPHAVVRASPSGIWSWLPGKASGACLLLKEGHKPAFLTRCLQAAQRDIRRTAAYTLHRAWGLTGYIHFLYWGDEKGWKMGNADGRTRDQCI